MKQKNNTVVKWIVKTVGSTNFLVVCLVALQAILSLSGVFYALVLRRIINSAVDGNRNAFFFFLAVLIVPNHGVGSSKHVAYATIVLLELNNLALRVIAFKLKDVANIRTAP